MTDDNDIDVDLFFTVKQEDKSAMIMEVVRLSREITEARNVAAQNSAYPMLTVVWEV